MSLFRRRPRMARKLRSVGSSPSALSSLGSGVRRSAAALRHAVRPVRFNPRPRRPRATKTRSGHVPHFRRRRSVVERVMPSGDPSPPRTVIRLRVMGAVAAVLLSLMFVRLWYLQVLDSASFQANVTANAVRQVEVPPARGLILDRAGNTVVGDQVTQDLTLSRVAAQQHPSVVGALAALLGISAEQIQGDLANLRYSLYKPVPIMENAPLPDVLYIGEHASQFPGVSTVADTNRTYPLGTTGAQTLGYMAQISKLKPGYQLGDLIGTSGLEQQYETALRGTPGTDNVEVDAQGNVVGSLGTTPPRSGQDLVTNIDSGLEQTLQQALDSEISSLHGASKGGAAVALDPQTGAVLALVSSPTYDPTLWNNGISIANYAQLQQTGALNNNAIDGLYTPGSTFKLATATAALQTGLISPGYTFDDTGTYTIPGCAAGGSGCATYHDNEGEAAGTVTVTQALTVSSDIFFYNLGVQFWDARSKYGQSPIQDTANTYGYGEVTGIDLPGETQFARVDSPAVVKKEHQQYPKAYPNGTWYTGDNLEMAFGQGGTVITPIEQAVAYATFANGGTRYAPQIGAGLVDPNGKVIQAVAPKVTGHVALSPSDRQAMLAGFEGVVQSPKGTAHAVFSGFPLSTFPLAGKTGTATTNERTPTSWFVAWGPVPNPQYLIAVVVQAGGYGASAAGPVVRAGFDYLVAHPESPVKVAAPPTTGSGICPGSSSTSTTSPASTTTSTGAGTGGTTSTTATSPSLCGTAPSASSTTTTAPGNGPHALGPTPSVTEPSPEKRTRPPPGAL